MSTPRIHLFVVLSFVALAAAPACSKKEKGKDNGAVATEASKDDKPDPTAAAKPGSCDNRKDTGVCTDHKQAMADMCTSMGGVAADAPCPTAGLAGTCALENGDVKNYYTEAGGGTYTPESGAEMCVKMQQGKWAAATAAK